MKRGTLEPLILEAERRSKERLMRTRQITVNIDQIKKLVTNVESSPLDYRPVIAVTMRECGASYQDIADVMGFTRQMAKTMTDNAKATS